MGSVDYDSQLTTTGGIPSSQPLSSQFNAAGAWSQSSQRSNSQEQLAIDRILFAIEDEEKIVSNDFDEGQPKKKRLIANFDHIPNNSRAPKQYKEAVASYKYGNTRTGYHFKGYAPGLNGFVRFPQSEIYEPVRRRQILRTLATDCYFGKDKSGTLLALKEIAKVMCVEFPHLCMLLDILREFKNGQEYLYKIYQAVVQRKPSRYRFNRCREIALLSDVFLSIGAVEVVSNLFESKIADPAFNQSPSLVATHALLICQRAVLISQEILTLLSFNVDVQSVLAPFGIQEIPTLNQVSAQPLKFAVCIRLINTKGITIENELKQSRTASSHNNQNFVTSEIKNLQFKCRKVLVDLKGTLVSAANLMEGQSGDGAATATGLFAMCIAFFEGMEQYDKAWLFLMDIWAKEFPTNAAAGSRFTENRVVNVESQQLFLRLVAEYICNFKLKPFCKQNRDRYRNRSTNVQETFRFRTGTFNEGSQPTLVNHAILILLTVFKKLILLPVSRKSPEIVYLTIALYQFSILTAAEVTSVLCDAIEYSLPKKTHANSRVCFRHVKGMKYRPINQDIDSDHPGGVDVYHWYIWRTLATTLGSLTGPALTLDTALAPQSDLYPYFQGGPRNSFGFLRENMPVEESLHVDAFVLLEKESPPEIEASAEDDGEVVDEEFSFTKEEARQRSWWRYSILAAHQLGDFADAPTFTMNKARAIVDSLPVFRDDDKNNDEEINSYRLQGFAVPGLQALVTKLLTTTSITNQGNNDDTDSDHDTNSDNDYGDIQLKNLGLDSLDDRITKHSELSSQELEEIKSTHSLLLAELVQLFSSEVFLSPLMEAFFSNSTSNISFNIFRTTSEVNQPAANVKQKNKFSSKSENKSNHSEQSRSISLGNGLLEMVTFQAIVSSHLAHSQDNMFTIRAVEILLQHAVAAERDTNNNSSLAALKCLSYLSDCGVNLHRCLHLSSLLANYTDASVNAPTPPLRGSDQRVQVVSFFGTPYANTYRPNTAF